MKKEFGTTNWLASNNQGEQQSRWVRLDTPHVYEVRAHKVFKPHNAALVEPGDAKLLTAADGFPWCTIPSEAFSARGISMKDIDTDETDYIIAQGITDLYPELISQQLRRFQLLYTMGIYVDDRPAGFSYAGMRKPSPFLPEDETTKKIAEVGLIHIVPNFRDKGYGSLLSDMTRLRLLSLDPDHLLTHVSDTSGKVAHMLNDLHYEATGKIDRAGNPEFIKDVRGTKKETMQQELEDRIRKRL
jgi:hypothetical protein